MSKTKFPYYPNNAVIALRMDDYYIWDTSVIKVGNHYYMFSSRWPKAMGFSWNWIFNSEIALFKADKPEGPYRFVKVVLPRRGKQYFDGMNTHNTNIKYFDGKFYLYYMGTTYDIEPPKAGEIEQIPHEICVNTWNHKRIGLAISNQIDGDYIRKDKPLLEPRKNDWDATAITNPTVAILENGKTYMIYKSRHHEGATLQLGMAVADHPKGPYRRLSDRPLFNFDNPNLHVEDPFLWYDQKKKKLCLLAKDDSKNGDYGITGEWGAGFYAESDDGINFDICPDKVYSRTIKWKDGQVTTQGNLERVSLLFDDYGEPTHMFFASGGGNNPYSFKDGTFIVCMKLYKK